MSTKKATPVANPVSNPSAAAVATPKASKAKAVTNAKEQEHVPVKRAPRPKLAERLTQQSAIVVKEAAKAKAVQQAWEAAGNKTTLDAETGMLVLQVGDSPVTHHFVLMPDETMVFNHTFSPTTSKVFSGLRHTLWVYRLIARVTGMHI